MEDEATIRGWSKIELDWLRENYRSASNERLEYMLSRTIKSICLIADRIGLKRLVVRQFADSIDELREYYFDHSAMECAAKFRTPPRIINSIIAQYGMKHGDGYVRKHTNAFANRPWTEEEIEILKEMYPCTKTHEIPIHRTTAAISFKAKELGLKKSDDHLYQLRHDFGWALRRRLGDKSINTEEWVERLRKTNLGG